MLCRRTARAAYVPLLCFLLFGFAGAAFYENTPVQSLNPEELEALLKVTRTSEMVAPQAVLVDFYAPGNEHSQKYAPMLIEIANRLTASNWTNAVQIVALDCVVYNDACKMYKVDTYPDVRIKLLGNDDDPAKVVSTSELGVGPLLSSMYLELKGSCTGGAEGSPGCQTLFATQSNDWYTRSPGDTTGESKSSWFERLHQLREKSSTGGGGQLTTTRVSSTTQEIPAHSANSVASEIDVVASIEFALANEVWSGLPPEGDGVKLDDRKTSAIRWMFEALGRTLPTFGPYYAALTDGVPKANVSRSDWKKAFADVERAVPHPQFPTSWSAQCTSRPYSDYTCGLWTTFHALVAAAPDGRDAYFSVVAVLSFVRNIFGCVECRDQINALEDGTIVGIPAFADVPQEKVAQTMWLFAVHNHISASLGAPQFPSVATCPPCRNEDDTWANAAVMNLLARKYHLEPAGSTGRITTTTATTAATSTSTTRTNTPTGKRIRTTTTPASTSISKTSINGGQTTTPTTMPSPTWPPLPSGSSGSRKSTTLIVVVLLTAFISILGVVELMHCNIRKYRIRLSRSAFHIKVGATDDVHETEPFLMQPLGVDSDDDAAAAAADDDDDVDSQIVQTSATT